MKAAAIIVIGTILYYLLIFSFGISERLGEINVFIAFIITAMIIPGLFGRIMPALIYKETKISPYSLALMPVVAILFEYLVGFIRGESPEKIGLVILFVSSQIAFFIIGIYMFRKGAEKIHNIKSQE